MILVHHLYVVPAFNKLVGRKVDEEGSSKQEEADAVGRLFTKCYTPCLLKTCAKQNDPENVDRKVEKHLEKARGGRSLSQFLWG